MLRMAIESSGTRHSSGTVSMPFAALGSAYSRIAGHAWSKVEGRDFGKMRAFVDSHPEIATFGKGVDSSTLFLASASASDDDPDAASLRLAQQLQAEDEVEVETEAPAAAVTPEPEPVQSEATPTAVEAEHPVLTAATAELETLEAPKPEVDIEAIIAEDPNQIVAPPEKPKRGWWRR
jgi:hypothetical protein